MMKITGSIVALITPFSDGAVDFGTLEKLIELHIASGTDAIVTAGTTGELFKKVLIYKPGKPRSGGGGSAGSGGTGGSGSGPKKRSSSRGRRGKGNKPTPETPEQE